MMSDNAEYKYLLRDAANTQMNGNLVRMIDGGVRIGNHIQDFFICSSRECLTSSRAETSKKYFCSLIWGQNDLFYSNVIKHSLKLACFLLKALLVLEIFRQVGRRAGRYLSSLKNC